MFKFVDLLNGKRVLRALVALAVSYSNGTSGLVSDNVQDALDELAANARGFSVYRITGGVSITIPTDNQMVVCGTACIIDGDYCIDGEICLI